MIISRVFVFCYCVFGVVIFVLIFIWVVGLLVVQEVEVINFGFFFKSLQVVYQVVVQYGIIEGMEDVECVQCIGYVLVKVFGYEDYLFIFVVVDMLIFNVFVLLVGQIFVMCGMFDFGLNDDMFVVFFGYEIVYVMLCYFFKMCKCVNLFNVFSQFVVVGVIVVLVNNCCDVYVGFGGFVQYDNNLMVSFVQGVMMVSMVVSEFFLCGYSCENEDQSDEEGQCFVVKVGFDFDGVWQLMVKMQLCILQIKSYGYWQMYFFFDECLQVVEVCVFGFKVEELLVEVEVVVFCEESQKVLFDFIEICGGKLVFFVCVVFK